MIGYRISGFGGGLGLLGLEVMGYWVQGVEKGFRGLSKLDSLLNPIP